MDNNEPGVGFAASMMLYGCVDYPVEYVRQFLELAKKQGFKSVRVHKFVHSVVVEFIEK